MVQIPLSSGCQSFQIQLGRSYATLTLVYRAADCGGWFLDIDVEGGAAVHGLPLVPGVDMLAQQEHIGLGHLYCLVDGRTERSPTFDDMGSAVSLYWEA